MLIKLECVKERQADRDTEAEKVMVSFSLSLISFFHTYMYINKRERGKSRGKHKESGRRVYNALKPVRHLLLYIKPVNSVGNVPKVSSTHCLALL